MSLRDDAADLSLEVDKVAKDRDHWKARSEQLADELDQLRTVVAVHEKATGIEPPRWLTPKKPKRHRATVCTILSDTHFDEVVRASEVRDLNAYSRTIAEMRLRRWAEQVIRVSQNYLAGVDFDGLVVMLGGDIFSGNLHDLPETNEDTAFGSLLHWAGQICAAFELLAGEFGKVYVPVVVGNHGRMTKKPRTKLRARDNLDWLLGHLVASHFHGDKRVTVSVEEDTDALVPVYDTVHLLTHGDQVNGGGGIGGIWPPIMRMAARKQQSYAGQRGFDLVVMGHWHQLITAPSQGLIINGSLKGFDEFAKVKNFRPEPPQQALWLVTPERGITITAPVFVADREAEGW